MLILNRRASLKSLSHLVSPQKVGLLYKYRYYFKVVHCSVFAIISSNCNNKTVYLMNPREVFSWIIVCIGKLLCRHYHR